MKAKDERKILEKMIENSPKEITQNVPDPKEDLEGLSGEPLIGVNFDEVKTKCEYEAKIMINNAISFMIPKDMIENNEYLQNKIDVDILSLAGMIYQLRTNEIMQKTLIEQVNSGMAHPRMFEVFAGMSKTIAELNKQLIQTVEAIKETYKSFKQDVKDQRTEALGPSTNSSGMLTTGDGGVITRGTKELINNVKRIKQANNIEDIYLDNENLVPDINLDVNPE